MEIKLLKADLTQQKVDAIVNAANSSLLGGGGVDGAIHRAGGPQILKECKEIVKKQGNLPAGEAVITSAGKMSARFVIHTVGPIWRGGKENEEQLLKNCYKNSLKLAEERKLKSIAFPNISTGVYGYPKQEAAEIAVKAVKNFKSDHIKKCLFVCFDQENFDIYQELLR